MKVDIYEDLFSNSFSNWTLAIIYIVGLTGCIGLGLVSWFEKSGQAGPYRTLLNQLTSFKLELVRFCEFMYL